MKPGILNRFSLAVIFLLIWGIYLKTLCPTLYVGDSGELITAGYGLGIAHPPGYPIYSLLGRIFSLVPLGELALRFNLLSAFFSASAVTGLALFLLLAYSDLCLATALSLTWGLGLAYWEMAISTEVYPVASLLLLLLLITLHQPKRKTLKASLYPAALFMGLGICAHYGFLLFAPGVLAYLVCSYPPARLKSAFFLILILGLLGFATFGYLPLRASSQPSINWGNPVNLRNLLNHLQRTEYDEVGAQRGWVNFLEQFRYQGWYLRRELPLFSGFVALLGLGVSLRRRRAQFWLSLLVILTMSLVGAFFLNYDLPSRALGFGPKFFIPFYLILLIELAGLFSLCFSLTRGRLRLLKLTVLLLPLISLIGHYHGSNLRGHRLAYYLGIDILNTVPARSYLFLEEEDNELFILSYFANVLARRADLELLDPYANLFPRTYETYFRLNRRRPPDRRYRNQVEQLAREQSNPRSIYYTIKPGLNAPLLSSGLLYYQPNLSRIPALPQPWKYYHNRQWSEVPLNYWSRYIEFVYSLRQGEFLLSRQRNQRALHVINRGFEKVKDMQWLSFNLGVMFQERGLYEQARMAYLHELNLGISNRDALINLGLIYDKLNQPSKALATFAEASELKEDGNLYEVMAKLSAELLDYRQAEDYYQQAIRLRPTVARFHFNRALNMMKLNRVQAQQLWREFQTDPAIKMEPLLLEQARHFLQESTL